MGVDEHIGTLEEDPDPRDEPLPPADEGAAERPGTEVAVVGAGLAGLMAAALVARAGVSVTVYEHRNRPGGRATTDERDGYRFNQGPHALYRGGPATEVLAELGITPSGARPPLRGATASWEGRLVPLPAGPVGLVAARWLTLRDKASFGRAVAALMRADPGAWAHRTVDDLLDHLADRPRVRALLGALIRLATYVNAPAVCSAEVAVRQVAAVRRGVLYLRGGWEAQLVGPLAATPGVRLVRGRRVDRLPEAPAVIVATGGPEAASALTGVPFAVGPAARASVLDLGLRSPAPRSFVLGVDEPLYLSDHTVAGGMAPPGAAAVSAAAYLTPDGPPVDRDALWEWATGSGIRGTDVAVDRYLRRMTVVGGIATAAGGGLAGRPPVAVPDRPGVFVAGDWVGPEGHLTDAVAASARAAARAAVAAVRARTR